MAAESIEPAKAPLKPVRISFIPKHALCHLCGQKARELTYRVYSEKTCPVTGETVRTAHPQPLIYGYCDCGNSWTWRIPPHLVSKIVLPDGKTTDTPT